MRALVVLSATVHVPVSVVHCAATFYGAIRAPAQEVAAGAATFTARHTCAGREKNVDGDGAEADGGGGVGEEEDEDEGTGSRRGKDRRRSVSRCMRVLFTGRHF